MQSNSWHHKVFYFRLPFESGKCVKAGERSQNGKYIENDNRFLYEVKSIYHSFSRAIIWWNIRDGGQKLQLSILLYLGLPQKSLLS